MEVTETLANSFGLSNEEYGQVLEIMQRTPTLTELGIFSVMWSEHCSYKSSRRWLSQFPTQAPWVIEGPGENAGAVDVGHGYAAIFKMESHNHPSYIEPFQGAATGVGGILRDVFTMGARPVANLNSLRFGDPQDPQTRRIVDGVVKGISWYGNCMGVPTVGGEVNFHPSYNGNPLVNAMTVGLARTDRIFRSKATGVGNPVFYAGARTGRDGIHGATMSSSALDADAADKRPTVQVGDPFAEKVLMEACLELMKTDAIIAIQDMGAAGLTSSSVEMAEKGHVGMILDLDNVPQREANLTAYEMMLSESQERMLMVIHPDKVDVARKIFEKWDVHTAVVGHLTQRQHLVVKHKGEIHADIPLQPLAGQAPKYDLPYMDTPAPKPLESDFGQGNNPLNDLKILLSSADLSSRGWVYHQYDSRVQGQTIFGPGQSDAAIVRIDSTNSALALTTDCTPRYCYADPYSGGKQAVAEAWRNLVASGARPLAITDNLNAGNPQNPKIMGQFVSFVKGMSKACSTLDFPVVSGNVSLNNETLKNDGESQAVWPAPVVGGLGVIDDNKFAMPLALSQNVEIVLIGRKEKCGHLGQSLWLREIKGRQDGAPPPVDLDIEKRHGHFITKMIHKNMVSACHDISDGGVLVAVAEMALTGHVGCKLDVPPDMNNAHFWFGENQACYLVATSYGAALCQEAKKLDIPALIIGKSGGDSLVLPDDSSVSLALLKEKRESFFQN